MYVDSDHSLGLRRLAEHQDGVATRAQLETAGCSRAMIRAEVDARRWSVCGAAVIVLHNHQLTRRQWMRVALLDAGGDAALCSHTALELAGFKAFAQEAAAVHLLVPRGARVSRLPGVVVHESRRIQPEDHVRPGIRRTANARSAVDAGAWQRWPRFACAMLAAVVQQGLASVDDVDEALRRAGRVRHKAHLRVVLSDVRGGSESLGELDLMAMCRRFTLMPPARRQIRVDLSGGRRYLDAEWDLPDGSVVVLEVDGRHHLDVAAWQDDIRRERGVVATGRRVLRATTVELRLEPHLLAADLLAVGVGGEEASRPLLLIVRGRGGGV